MVLICGRVVALYGTLPGMRFVLGTESARFAMEGAGLPYGPSGVRYALDTEAATYRGGPRLAYAVWLPVRPVRTMNRLPLRANQIQ